MKDVSMIEYKCIIEIVEDDKNRVAEDVEDVLTVLCFNLRFLEYRV